jgi:hypothetical protein
MKIAFALSVLVFIGLEYYRPDYWKYFIGLFLAFVISGILQTKVIRGGGGIVQVGNDNKAYPRGHGYLIFLFFIIAGTVVSGYLSDYLANQLSNYAGMENMIISNVVIAGIVYGTFWLTYIRRR